MSADQKNEGLSPEDALLIERLSAHYAPPSMTPARRIAFNRVLAERLTARPRNPLLRPVAVVVSACATVLIWFTLLQHDAPQSPSGEGKAPEVAIARESIPPLEEVNLLTYAYYSQDFDEEDEEGESDDFLPEEYEAFDSAIANPDA